MLECNVLEENLNSFQIFNQQLTSDTKTKSLLFMIGLEESRPVAYSTRVSIIYVYLINTNEKRGPYLLFSSKLLVKFRPLNWHRKPKKIDGIFFDFIALRVIYINYNCINQNFLIGLKLTLYKSCLLIFVVLLLCNIL